ncbi:hypothetical protein K9L63_00480 [Candidatus Gracilibacteria bacterium]|nr:hypothetical protein [Candidatus Gracilibacteria bacterium]
MKKFNLTQLSLSTGVFGILFFLAWWGWALVFPTAAMHRQFLLEMIPGAIWPLGIEMFLLGVLVWLLCGLICGFVFGVIFNFFSNEK